MIYYKEMFLLSKEELLKTGIKNPNYNLHMIGDMYLQESCLLDKIIKAVGLEEKGSYDYAVPQSWFEQHMNEWKDDPYKRAIWFYPRDLKEEGHLMGKPMRVAELLGMLHKQIVQEAFDLWIKTNTEEGI